VLLKGELTQRTEGTRSGPRNSIVEGTSEGRWGFRKTEWGLGSCHLENRETIEDDRGIPLQKTGATLVS